MKFRWIVFFLLLPLPVQGSECPLLADTIVKKFHEEVVGAIASTRKEAFEKWELSCKEWKQQLKALNPNNLVSASCGKYKHYVEKNYSNELHHYESKASFVVRYEMRFSSKEQEKPFVCFNIQKL